MTGFERSENSRLGRQHRKIEFMTQIRNPHGESHKRAKRLLALASKGACLVRAHLRKARCVCAKRKKLHSLMVVVMSGKETFPRLGWKRKSSRGERKAFCFLKASFSCPEKQARVGVGGGKSELFTLARYGARSNERMGTLERILGVKVDAGQDLSALELFSLHNCAVPRLELM